MNATMSSQRHPRRLRLASTRAIATAPINRRSVCRFLSASISDDLTENVMTTNRRPLLRLFFVLLLNITAFAISIPVLPALAESLGGNPVDVGMLYATQALGQFLMAPGWGALSDSFGRKRILMATFAAAAVLELTTAFVPSL